MLWVRGNWESKGNPWFELHLIVMITFLQHTSYPIYFCEITCFHTPWLRCFPSLLPPPSPGSLPIVPILWTCTDFKSSSFIKLFRLTKARLFHIVYSVGRKNSHHSTCPSTLAVYVASLLQCILPVSVKCLCLLSVQILAHRFKSMLQYSVRFAFLK